MKNKILIVTIIFIVLVIIVVATIIVSKALSENEIPNPNIDLTNENEVVSVKLIEETEGGYLYYQTFDKDLILSLIEALDNIKVLEQVDIASTDNSKYYIVEFNDKSTLEFCFQGAFYRYNNKNYKIENYNTLSNIKLPKI